MTEMRYAVYASRNGFGELVGYGVGPETKNPTNMNMVASFHIHADHQNEDAQKYAGMFRDYLNKLEEAKDKAAKSIKLGE